MSDLRYNRVFKKALAAILFCTVLFSSIVIFFIVFKIQYDQLVSGMKPLEATIVDVDSHFTPKGLNWQEIYIEYAVDGIVYNRELKTDIAIFFRAGTGAHYSAGDKVPIFYNPQNPEIIASPRSVSVGYFWLIFALFFLCLVLFALWYVIKRRHKFLVTQEEYEKEGEGRKKAKKEKRKAKKEKRKANRQKLLTILKAILIFIAALMVGFILFYFFKGLIKGIRN